ncbi:ABC transporter ATP-binding protein [Cellulomonas sp. HZM]|uniref:ABC transporter ATP-binding protein n=1 Tax=Cellulomonas sp. HZM TaxID=1454010 RepID=UPI00054D3049|nr:ATP-binding cassette domain-containing protein [Cellulomonas sp. HZM]
MPTLEIDSLDKSYGPTRALRGMSFDVRAGEIFGFVGSNGAGKSTTMRIVLGVLEADGGEVRWDGSPIDADTRRRIGYMPEERGLYPRMKVADQLVYLARLHGLSASDARASMERWTHTLGIAERRGDEVLKLSLGNQQRVQLAAALVHEPDILVLDEPFSGLDPVAVDVMSGVLREAADAGRPVVFSSHQLELVERISDRVGIVKAGSMVAVGGIDLRRTEHRRWSVVGPPDDAWVGAVPGVRVATPVSTATSAPTSTPTSIPTSTASGRPAPVVVDELPGAAPDVDQALLRAALATGPVHEFSLVRPSLAELYRDVVASDDPVQVDDAVQADKEAHA